jgi:hypothetical protein
MRQTCVRQELKKKNNAYSEFGGIFSEPRQIGRKTERNQLNTQALLVRETALPLNYQNFQKMT